MVALASVMSLWGVVGRARRVGAAGHRASRTAGAGRGGRAGGGLSRFARGQVVMPELSTSLLNSIRANPARLAAPNTFNALALRSLCRLWRCSDATGSTRRSLHTMGGVLWCEILHVRYVQRVAQRRKFAENLKSEQQCNKSSA